MSPVEPYKGVCLTYSHPQHLTLSRTEGIIYGVGISPFQRAVGRFAQTSPTVGQPVASARRKTIIAELSVKRLAP